MKLLFDILARGLYMIGRFLNLTYNEVNMIVYYLLVPLSWTLMADKLIGLSVPSLTLALIGVWTCIAVARRGRFRQWCDVAFVKSQDFLLRFRRIGWNYVVSSVIICVVVPLLVYVVLIWVLLAS